MASQRKDRTEMELAIDKMVIELVHPGGSGSVLFGSGKYRTVVFIPLAASSA